MKKLFLFLSIAIVFSGCVVNSLSIKKEEDLRLSVDAKSQIISNSVIDKKYEYYKSIEIYKYILEDENKILFFEDVYIDDDYLLSYSLLNTIKYIFATKNVEIIAQTKDIFFVQLELDNKVFVNALLSYNYSQNISYVYGFSNHHFMKIVKNVIEDKKSIKRPSRQAITLDKSSIVLTKWSTKMLILQPLTSRAFRRSAF